MNAPAPTEIDHPNFEHLPGDTDKKKSRKTRYEIQEAIEQGEGPGTPPVWSPVGVVEHASARGAIREWFETNDSDSATPITLRAVPVRNITQVTIAFETHRQLTFS